MNRENQAEIAAKVYEAPLLTRFGSVVELTRNNTGSPQEAKKGGNSGCNGLGRPC